ncbi:hypothetical protein NC653_008245 [Populus alba x Populus x berolinensis]|uniref:Uncharacterized protein n=1 Tax=Populus alba x Populus x berolinensis TaxID=444605 RepID=A0AAD6R6A6_9ROSI|nr:hypothetical protein NC653_008245 [Populus alba x Populus x berolinensis]
MVNVTLSGSHLFSSISFRITFPSSTLPALQNPSITGLYINGFGIILLFFICSRKSRASLSLFSLQRALMRTA